MCGIAGYFGKGSKEKLEKMLDATEHRGPDVGGVFVDGNAGIGTNRLSVIDLSPRGTQPIFTQDRSACIVFNGEVYNFQSLRKELTKYYQFSSDTDTEVVLYAYLRYGVECLQKLDGMFGFVIYDRRKNLLFGARDRLGEKPLCYYLDSDIFAFASEVKALLKALNIKPEIDPVAINDFLTLQYVPAPRTGFKKIHKLPAAHYFTFKQDKLTIKRYWKVDFSEKLKLPEEEWVKLLLQKMNATVKSRMIADVPIGAFLSGGVDSSAVVAFMAKNTKRRIRTFSIGFDDPRFDESRFAKEVSEKYNTNHSSLRVDATMMIDALKGFSDHYDEPFADNSLIPTLLLSQLASKYVKVALSGDGGDENFAGYERYNIVSFSDIYKRIPSAIRRVLNQSTNTIESFAQTQFSRRASTYTKTFELPFYRKYLYYSSFFTNEAKNKLYSKQFKESVKEHDTFSLYKSLFEPKLEDLDNALFFDMTHYLPEDLLYKTDIASMAFSLEVRAPLLGHEFVELVAKMPAGLKIKMFNNKYIFKKFLSKNNIVPRSILQRRKQGFVIPLDTWLRGELRSLLVDQVSSQKVRDCGIFDQVKVEKYLASYFNSNTISSNSVFALLALSSWINTYF